MNDEKNKIVEAYQLLLSLILIILVAIILIPFLQFVDFSSKKEKNITNMPKLKEEVIEIIDGKDVETGLIVDKGWEVVKTNCTKCHNSKIILQNRFTKKGWKELIVWMQETQGLWQLGENEKIILDYLAKNYAPQKKGRRANLPIKKDDWYILEE